MFYGKTKIILSDDVLKSHIVPATAYFPPGMHQSIIGADWLNDRVRDGNGCGPAARITETI